jgi:hypothetical protein
VLVRGKSGADRRDCFCSQIAKELLDPEETSMLPPFLSESLAGANGVNRRFSNLKSSPVAGRDRESLLLLLGMSRPGVTSRFDTGIPGDYARVAADPWRACNWRNEVPVIADEGVGRG